VRIHLVVEEVELARVRVALLAHQAHEHGAGIVAAGVGAGARQPGELQVGSLVSVEVGVDRVVGHHRGQHVAARHQVSLGDQRPRDMAVNRRAHSREVQIQPRRVQLRTDRTEISRSLGGGRGQLLVFLAGDRVLRKQALGARPMLA
jgi:hypothetical protein